MSTDFESAIAQQYLDAYQFAAGAIVIGPSLLMVFWSDGAKKMFGYKDVIGGSISLLKLEGINEQFVCRELTRSSDSKASQSHSFNNGDPVKGTCANGKNIFVRCNYGSLLLNNETYLCLFFEKVENSKSILGSLPTVEKVKEFSDISKRLIAIIAIFITSFASFVGGFLEKIPQINLSIPKHHESAIEIAEKSQEVKRLLRRLRLSTRAARVFIGFYQTNSSNQLVVYLPLALQDVELGEPLSIPGNRPIDGPADLERFRQHQSEDVWQVTITKIKAKDSLIKILQQRGAITHISKGFSLFPSSGKDQYTTAFVAIEYPYLLTSKEIEERTEFLIRDTTLIQNSINQKIMTLTMEEDPSL